MRGTLFLVVGPSGSGKDSLIDGARCALGEEAGFLFPVRAITRPSSAGGERHLEMSPEQFDRAVYAGEFGLWWSAHGLKYGVFTSDLAALDRGRHVIVNVSRTVLDEARARYASVRVLSVCVSSSRLRDRLLARSRESELDVDARLRRANLSAPQGADVHAIPNDADLAQGISQMIAVLRRA